MSLQFFAELGVHGPIEPELASIETSKHNTNTSRIHTSQGMLQVHIDYKHSVGMPTPQAARKRRKMEGVTLPIQFRSAVPEFSPGLLRQLRLLEWTGLYKPLHSALDDLNTIAEDDRLLLLSNLHSARIEIRMPTQLAEKTAKNTRLILWLLSWMQTFRRLTQDPQSDGDNGLPCHLTLRHQAGEVVAIEITSASSVTVSANLRVEMLSVPGVDGLPHIKAAVGTHQALRAWCRRERKDESEVLSITQMGPRTPLQQPGVGDRPPSLTLSSTTATSPRSCRTPSLIGTASTPSKS